MVKNVILVMSKFFLAILFLILAAEKLPNVNFNFAHKLVNSDLDKGTMTFKKWIFFYFIIYLNQMSIAFLFPLKSQQTW